MSDFDVCVVSGAEARPWFDLPSGDDPSRLNTSAGRPPLYYRVAPGAEVVLAAVVEGVEGPADDDLDGRLFVCSWAEWAGPFAPHYAQAAAQSSVATITIAPEHAGHFVFNFWRQAGGSVSVHLDVEP